MNARRLGSCCGGFPIKREMHKVGLDLVLLSPEDDSLVFSLIGQLTNDGSALFVSAQVA